MIRRACTHRWLVFDFFFSSRRRHTRLQGDWSSDVCSSDLFVSKGGIAPGGRLAVNTNGGGLSCVHPGMYGIFALIEAVRQLRGAAGQRQLGRHRTAVVHGNGGTPSSPSTAGPGTPRNPLTAPEGNRQYS